MNPASNKTAILFNENAFGTEVTPTDQTTDGSDMLLPCPFCGGPATFDEWEVSISPTLPKEHAVEPRCAKEHPCCMCGSRGNTREQAAEFWNNRHTP